ncbi:hypothetical protein [Rubrivirga sp.]|uniref:hypothetical protein n=1 Tax=Rubrivirga sp. TaxID=1885344 RepID=UPI003B522D82
MPGPIWTLSDFGASTRDGTSRAQALLDGEPLWFESDTHALEPLPEAFAAGLVIPALHAGATIRIEGDLDERWVDNIRQLADLYAGWWDLRATLPLDPTGLIRRPSVRSDARAQCFTGGVDSFYTLLKEPEHRTTHLFFAESYERALVSEAHWAAVRELLGEVADEFGIGLLSLRSNLRSFPQLDGLQFGTHTQGGALAAGGLVYSSAIDVMTIPSSYGYVYGTPYGTHWDLDPLWSLPGRIEFVHGDAPIRSAKVAAIIGEPAVQAHLRVCWMPGAPPGGNCSRCEKCVRTMMSLANSGDLDRFARFDTSVPLAKRVHGLQDVVPSLWGIWADLGRDNPDRSVRLAVRWLLARSRLRQLRMKAGVRTRARAIRDAVRP